MLKKIWESQWLPPVLIVLATVVAYLPALGAGFIWDDDAYVTRNPTLHDLRGLADIWFKIGAVPQYYPLVHTSFWLEYHVWALNPFGYHLVNILLHAFAAVLLWRLLARLEVPGAWLAAAIFALHPVQVESVAWITERKNVLSAVFYLAAALCYLRFTERRDQGVLKKQLWPYYSSALVMFVAALLSKTVTASLPAALLLLCWWKRDRLRWNDFLPLVPFFFLGAALGLLTAWTEKHYVGAVGADWSLTFSQRFQLAGRAFWFYIGKLVWPLHLTFIYPRWNINPAEWWQWAFLAAAFAVTVALWLARRSIGRGPVTAILLFTGMLAPALGFVNVYPFRYSFVADHFQYLASSAPIALAAVALSRVHRVISLALLTTLVLLTWSQAHAYHDLETLWKDTLAKNPSCWMAYNNLGNILAEKGEIGQATAYFQRAIELKPDYPEAYNNLGNLFMQEGHLAEATAHFQRALEIQPRFEESYFNLGCVLQLRGDLDQAIVQYQKALEIKPDDAEVHNNIGVVLLKKGQVKDAIAHYQRATGINPDYAEAQYNLGNAFFQAGNFDNAILHLEKALEIKPDYAEAHCSLGRALARMERRDQAVAHLSEALRLNPDYEEAKQQLRELDVNIPR